jgi:hypothetical protein
MSMTVCTTTRATAATARAMKMIVCASKGYLPGTSMGSGISGQF